MPTSPCDLAEVVTLPQTMLDISDITGDIAFPRTPSTRGLSFGRVPEPGGALADITGDIGNVESSGAAPGIREARA